MTSPSVVTAELLEPSSPWPAYAFRSRTVQYLHLGRHAMKATHLLAFSANQTRSLCETMYARLGLGWRLRSK